MQSSRDHNVVEPDEPGSRANRRLRDSVTEIVTVPPSFHQVPVVDRDATPPAEVAAVYLLDPPLYGSLGDTDALFFATDRYSDGTVNGYLAAPTGSGVPSCTREFREQDIAMLGAMAAEYPATALGRRRTDRQGDKSRSWRRRGPRRDIGLTRRPDGWPRGPPSRLT